ncbi:MAG: UvrB/UvrC motif-containing protein [Clostridia bacterium]|nr:UvrB/UvrC motif-containing protein [Clostridia bacterium]
MMLCDECGVNQATISVTTIINGKKTHRNLCSACMKKTQQEFSHDFSLAGLLGGVTDYEGEVKRCSRCGMDYRTFKKTGLLGCAQCYEDFAPQLEPMLKRIHGTAKHAGKVPTRDPKAVEMDQLEELKRQLNEAIREEKYEKAALLRDQIRGMQKEESK